MSNEKSGRTIRIGLLGCGNVGGGFMPLLGEQADEIEQRTGLRLEVTRVAVRNLARDRGIEIPEAMLTRDAHEVVNDPAIDLVIEVIGGIEPARELISTALQNGKPVVTGNKELLANHGVELFGIADEHGVDLLFEAAVAGGIPLIRPLRESLLGEPVHRVMGILNGTTNFILSKMAEEGSDYGAALAEAQELGYAERDPTADVEGYDAGAKAAIIATIAFGDKVVAGDVYHEGISNVSAADIGVARRLGYTIKLLGIAERDDEGAIAVRVHPAMVPNSHPLATVRDSFNAVFVEGGAVGQLMFYGRGAGGSPTASAVLGDVIDAAINLSTSTHAPLGTFRKAAIIGIDETTSEYFLALDVADKPGVLHQVTGAFAAHGVSIRAAEQEGTDDNARLVFITHEAREADVRATVRELRDLDSVTRIGSIIRVIAG